MPCYWVKLPGGGMAHINAGRGRAKRCSYCPNASVVLCDAPNPMLPGKTCDRPCCRAHAKNVGPDKDLCRDHAVAASKEAK